ncbi:hypothetical protein EPN27_01845 [Patescibacteria group bacterium]|nr:MAG: hypothetical protein EPN27_01845 [Patescibacteria group bacterium]
MVDISLIKNWHEKAKEDYFSRYIFEYLAFEAFLKKYKYNEGEIWSASGNTKERSYIQKIKNEGDYADKWRALILKSNAHKKMARELALLLQREPLLSDVNWWGCSEFNYNDCPSGGNKGAMLDENDFINMVEFWYQVRNNLFHAGKNPDNKRDETLVMYAYATLSVFMEEVLLPEMEGRTIYPAIWEEFEHKFFKGKAEATIKIRGYDTRLNVYHLLFADNEFFPVILNGRQVDRAYVIDKVSFNLTNLYGDPTLLKREWDKIIREAEISNKKSELGIYFNEVLPLLRDAITDFNI